MWLMVAKWIRVGICHGIHQNARPNNKYMKNHEKNKELSYLKSWDVNDLYGWLMSRKLPGSKF